MRDENKKIAYPIAQAGDQVGMSEQYIRNEIKAHRIVAKQAGTKKIVGHAELERWFNGLPEAVA